MRERDRREGGVPGNVLVPARVFVHIIYSTLSIGPGNGSVLVQNFGGVPYKIIASKNGFMEAGTLTRLPPKIGHFRRRLFYGARLRKSIFGGRHFLTASANKNDHLH